MWLCTLCAVVGALSEFWATADTSSEEGGGYAGRHRIDDRAWSGLVTLLVKHNV